MGREAVSELLVKAALNGEPQIMGSYKTPDGKCALGVLHEAVHPHCEQVSHNTFLCNIGFVLTMEYHLSTYEQARIAYLNDNGADFLTIARKWENTENA